MSIMEYLGSNAPFLVSNGPLILGALLGAFIWSIVSKFRSDKSPSESSSTPPRETTNSTREDENLVFLDNDSAEHPDGSSEKDVDHVPYIHEFYSEEQMLERSRTFYDNMNQRRTVRKFSNKPVPLDVIRNIVHTAGESLLCCSTN